MNFKTKLYRKFVSRNIWERPEMQVTLRAEVMPGKNRQERTFRIKKVLPSGRVLLHGFSGEHGESTFEPFNFNKNKNL